MAENEFFDDDEISTSFNNIGFTELSIKRSTDPKIKALNNRFIKETVKYLKSIRAREKRYSQFKCSGMVMAIQAEEGQKVKLSEDFISSQYCFIVRYDVQKSKNETSIKFYINRDGIEGNEYVPENFVENFPKYKYLAKMDKYSMCIVNFVEEEKRAEKEKINYFYDMLGETIETENGTERTIREVFLENIEDENDDEEINDFIDEVWAKKEIYDYFKSLDILDEVYALSGGNFEYSLAINYAVKVFSKKFSTDDIDIITGIFDHSVYQSFGENTECPPTQRVIDESFFESDEKKEWYPCILGISIKEFPKFGDEDVTISVDKNTFYLPSITLSNEGMKKILEDIHQLREIYSENAAAAAKVGENIEDEPDVYKPHADIDGESHWLETLMMLSNKMELVEIPLGLLDSDEPMLCTTYNWKR